VSDELKSYFDSSDLAQPLLTAEEERNLLCMIHLECDGNKHVHNHACPARDEFIKRNMKLVLAGVRRFVFEGDPRMMDLVSVGTLGLIKGIDKFNIKAGLNGKYFRFSTYGMWWIQSMIREELSNYDSKIIRHKSYHDQFKKTRELLIDQYSDINIDDNAVYDYLRAECNWSDAKINKLKSDQDKRVVPIDSVPEGYDNEIEPSSKILQEESVVNLNRALDKLSFDDVYLLMSHYVAGETYDEIAKTFNLSRERIRQRENHALRRLWLLLSE